MAVEPFNSLVSPKAIESLSRENQFREVPENQSTALESTCRNYPPSDTVDDEDDRHSEGLGTEDSEEDNEADDSGARLWQIVRDHDEPMEEPEDLSDGDGDEPVDDHDNESEPDEKKLVIDASTLEVDEEMPAQPEEDVPDEPEEEKDDVPVPSTPVSNQLRGIASRKEQSSGNKGLPPFHGLPPKLVISFKFKYNNAGSPGTPSSSKQQTASPTKAGIPGLPPKWPGTVATSPGQPPMQRFSTPLRPLLPKPPSFELIPRSQYQKPPEPSGAPAHFPPKTVRRIMTFLTSTQDIRMSNPAVDAVAVALECFVRSFTQEAYRYAQRKNRTTLRYDDLAYVGNHYTNLYFLQDYLPAQEVAGYVVRKTLEESGVGFPKEILPAPQSEVLTVPTTSDVVASLKRDGDAKEKSPEKAPKVTKKPRKAPYDKNPLVESALVLAIRWGEDAKLKNWREMTRNSSKPKRQF